MLSAPQIVSSVLKYKVTRFDGASLQRIDMGNPAALQKERTDSFSIGLWAKFTGASIMVFCAKMLNAASFRGYVLYTAATGRWHCNLNNDTGEPVPANYINVSSTNLVNDNRWHHLLMAYGGTSTAAGIDLYTDGVLETKIVHKDNLTATIANGGSFNLGVQVSPIPFYYTGLLHDVSFYNKKLNATEAAQLHNSHCPPDLTSVGPTGSLVGYWLCGEHKGDANLASEVTSFPTVPDASTNNNAGTMTNMSAASVETRR